jgi:lactate dehydrogenase-like 2-hydroxyacid dehydrogenase
VLFLLFASTAEILFRRYELWRCGNRPSNLILLLLDARIESVKARKHRAPIRGSTDSVLGLDASPEKDDDPPMSRWQACAEEGAQLVRGVNDQQGARELKPSILQLNPILVPAINAKLAELYTMHRLFEQDDKEAYIREHGASIRGVITGGHTGISNDLIERLPALEVIAVNGVGTDAVDLKFARARGIPVTATFGALTEDVADLALGLMLAVCREICPGNTFVKTGNWQSNPHPGALPLSHRFSGKRVGIVGMGKVGRAIAQRASAFGCPITYTDLRAMDDVPHRFVGDLLSLARGCDILVLAAAADKAQGIVNAAVLDALGKDGYLVNIARGKLVVENDLVEALSHGVIAGAGLDVFVDEPNVPAALLDMDRVVLQAHRASATIESRTAMGEMVMASLAQALAGQRPEGSLTT